MSQWAVRWAGPIALALLVLIGASRSALDRPALIGAVTVTILAGLLLRVSRGWLLLVPAWIAAVAVAVVCSGTASNIGWFALCVLAGWCALQGGTAIGVSFSAAVSMLLILEWGVISTDPGWSAWIVGTLFTTITCLMARRQRDLLAQLRQAQAGLAERVRAEERLRISGELHDVIAHSLTVSLLHVTSARLAVEEDPEAAAGALAEAERLGRQSLTEVRQAVGLLRDGDAAGSRTPMPGVEQLPALIEGFRRAGVPVSYQLLGDLSCLPVTAGLTIYRIMQEALTNAARHAVNAHTSVRLETSTDQTVLTVHSGAAPAEAYVEGIGLHSMRQRAQALGGALEAGPSAGGWQVRAVLPRDPRGRIVKAAGAQ